MTSPVNFIIDENYLSVSPYTNQMLEWLSYWEKAMVKEGRKTIQTRVKVPLYRLLPDRPGVLLTHQGLWVYLRRKLEEIGVSVVMHDTRITFPQPRLDLIRNLYPLQEQFLKEGLSIGYSGIFSAPTRFGKSYVMAALINAFPGLKTVVLVPGLDLGRQLADDLAKLISRPIIQLGCGSKHRYQGDHVTICSMDSMHKLDHEGTKLVLIDEVHALVTDTRLKEFYKFKVARKYGFGATAAGRYDGRDLLTEAVIGPVLAEVTFTQAVQAGLIAPIEVFMLEIPYNPEDVPSDRQQGYKAKLWQNQYVANLVQAMCARVLPPDWQTLLFIEEEKSAEFFSKVLPGSFISMAKRMKAKERKAVTNQMVRGDITYCLASRIYSQGVTFPDLRVVINLTGGGANTYAVQKPGRVAQRRPNKRCGVLIDFMFRAQKKSDTNKGNWFLHRDSAKRLQLYKDRGYNVNVVTNLADFPRLFREKCL